MDSRVPPQDLCAGKRRMNPRDRLHIEGRRNTDFIILGCHHGYGSLSNLLVQNFLGPGQVVQLIRASSQYIKVVDLILSQGTYKD